MASYYYLTAQLPSIFPNLQPPMSFNAFKELALRSLSKKDAQILENLSLEPPREEKAQVPPIWISGMSLSVL